MTNAYYNLYGIALAEHQPVGRPARMLRACLQN